MKRGKFIVFEGVDGSGKTTMAKYARGYIERKGQPAVFTREPGGTAFGEELRSLLLSPPYSLSPMQQTLLVWAGRFDHMKKVIAPALEKGKNVICDRYVDSTEVYQGGEMNDLFKESPNYLEPDHTILLDISYEEMLKRKEQSDKNHFDIVSVFEFNRRRSVFKATAYSDDKHTVINADLSKQEVGDLVATTIEDILAS